MKGIFETDRSDMLKSRGISAFAYQSLDSTNSEARRYALSGGKAPAVFAADGQTGGRGRMGRGFFSPSGTGIYMTLLLDITDDALTTAVSLTSAAAVAVARTVERLTGVHVGIKWVNDIYANGKKVCGILAESFEACGGRYAAIGVGVNLCTEDFPKELEGIAGSLGVGDVDAIRAEMTVALAAGLYDIYEKVRSGDREYMNEYRARSTVLGKRVTFTENGVTGVGVATAIDDGGALEITLEDGDKKLLASGEISLRLDG